jgi:AraC-like DNA-binding protein
MKLTFTFLAFLYLTGAVLGLIVSLICWIYPRNRRSPIQLLGTSVFSLMWTLFIFFLYESQLIFYAPHLYQTSFIATILYLPFSFLFVRSVIQGDKAGVTWPDLLHVIPLLLFLADYSGIYLLSASDKVALLNNTDISPYNFLKGYFLPDYFHKPLRFLLFLLYTGLQFRLALRLGPVLRKWIVPYLGGQFFLILYYVLSQFTFSYEILPFVHALISVYLLFIALGLLLNPHILYNHRVISLAESKLIARVREDMARDSEKSRSDVIASRLTTFMNNDRPYLRHGYAMHNLSSDLQIPSYQLSIYLNHYLGISFNDYLNKHRIEYSKKLLREGANQLYTLEALAYECGFNNRNSFTAAFKRFTGVTPSEFIRSQRDNGFAESLKS